MNPSEVNLLDQPDTTVTLDPILKDGQAALSTHDTPAIAKAKLQCVHIGWSNTGHDVTILKADNLLSKRASARIPKRGRLIRALLDFCLPGAKKHGKVHLIPPKTVRFQNIDPALIHPWLSKRHFALPKQIVRSLALLLLAAAAALSPAMDDDDTDNDDDLKVLAA